MPKNPVQIIGLLFIALPLLLSSCVSHKELVSLNSTESVPEDLRYPQEVSNTVLYKYQPYKIQPYDQLIIRINAFDGTTEDFLSREFSIQNNNNGNAEYTPEATYFNSYIVNDSGYVYLPMLGRVEVTGYTMTSLKHYLDKAYSPYLRFASTFIKLANMRVTILGEVNRPGVHTLYNERTTLLDAISLAGDFTDFANRGKVKIIRQTNRNAHAVYLNLNKSDFLTSEYYYVQPSDVIYIEPIKKKALDVSNRTLSVVVSAVSLGALVLNVILN
ncbi:MAG: polysaccharide biosynthesis/export family protein [Bacteroidota bacterium]